MFKDTSINFRRGAPRLYEIAQPINLPDIIFKITTKRFIGLPLRNKKALNV